MVISDISKFDAYHFNLLIAKIKQTKTQFDADLDPQSEKGTRYNDDQRIARTVVSAIYEEMKGDAEAANKKFLSLNSEEMMPYIKAAVIDVAKADYYYKYEKQY